ncbi:MAG: tRNA(Ile)-lysidine synthetase (EC [uncultured Sulfurovum sp.]|uniref:tRNA(Ile)-lysidine synthase n=1 Tax=uncultured Sulfurovum sp. TaxID=269237 RepID=A0A6S6TJD7_9BACT|nr:MAG: tRNA(Ile)-lysidine synthetase (EC [uncultured Sulfurovum sp.]
MLDEVSLALLKKEKNLLAFSAGVDSSALFFLLFEHEVKFDIALVNYGLREQSKEEEAYALELAKAYNLQAHTIQAPIFEQNFEKNARDFRYAFFDRLMDEQSYDNLLTAHQLNDQLEWFFMRLTKGAGTSELLGIERCSKRKDYTLVRPLLEHTKEELLNYLKQKNHKYFVDESNCDEKYERNFFRQEFSNKLIENYGQGIRRSFKYLKEDKEILNEGYSEIFHEKELYILSYTTEHILKRVLDKYLKKLGYLLSAKQRELLKKEYSLVLGHLWAVEITKEYIFIAPYRISSMPKEFKEVCRKLKIPSKIRAYLKEEGINPTKLPRSF